MVDDLYFSGNYLTNFSNLYLKINSGPCPTFPAFPPKEENMEFVERQQEAPDYEFHFLVVFVLEYAIFYTVFH